MRLHPIISHPCDFKLSKTDEISSAELLECISKVSVAPQISGLLSLAFAMTSVALSLSYPSSQKVLFAKAY